MSNGEEGLGQRVLNGAIHGNFRFGNKVFGASNHGMRCRGGSRGWGSFWRSYSERGRLEKMGLRNISRCGLGLGRYNGLMWDGLCGLMWDSLCGLICLCGLIGT